MRAYSLGIGEVISLPQHGLTIEVLEVREHSVRLGIRGSGAPETVVEHWVDCSEPVLFLEKMVSSE